MKIGTLCSHSALQLLYGAKQEGFKTLGITKPETKRVYDSFPLSKPDEFIELENYQDLASMRLEDTVLIPHGSFVEYVGAQNLLAMETPLFGNKKSLLWESSRKNVQEWMQRAGLRVPAYRKPNEINSPCIVKYGGAKGGKGFFLVNSEEEFSLHPSDGECTIQEYITGVRYYLHFFNSLVHDRLEFFGADQRLESNVDGLHRAPQHTQPSFVVTGNAPVVMRESLLSEIFKIGDGVVDSSRELFGGIIGPFCVETILTPELEFYCFEISARIVAGTNLYPQGSPYTAYYFNEPMSMGRRIARELKQGTCEELTT